eukprot:TRINITY_DN70295_c0_g1_i1.p1 TRINITY_DN70295_c0_g1~~TRINITY_DN70295_c0_g1_i1.p1  ORF type:complete len:461 (-),score=61.65 TRINITY_DN70295_c0_g1_i1:221-1603(-)
MAVSTTTPPAQNATIRPGAESQFMAAVMERRLAMCHQEAVYYMLRGLGMPVTGRSGQLPRIQVPAAKYPTLFTALKRLGLKPTGDRFIIEPRADSDQVEEKPGRFQKSQFSSTGGESSCSAGGAVVFNATRNLGVFTKPKDVRVMSRPGIAGDTSSHSGRRPPKEDELEAMFSRLAMPKQAQSRAFVIDAIAEARDKAEAETDEVVTPPRRTRGLQPSQARPFGGTIPARLRPSQPEEAMDPPGWFKGPARFDPTEQRALSDRLARPKSLNRKPRTAATMPPNTVMSAAGKAARRDLFKRLAKVEAAGGYPWQVASRDSALPWEGEDLPEHFRTNGDDSGMESYLRPEVVPTDAAAAEALERLIAKGSSSSRSWPLARTGHADHAFRQLRNTGRSVGSATFGDSERDGFEWSLDGGHDRATRHTSSSPALMESCQTSAIEGFSFADDGDIFVNNPVDDRR